MKIFFFCPWNLGNFLIVIVFIFSRLQTKVMNTLTIDHVTRRDLDTIYICQVDMSTFIGLLSLFQLSQGIGFFGFHQGNYIQELTSELRGFIWFFHYTFSYKVVSEIDSSNNFQSLYTAKSFLNWKVVLNNRQMHAVALSVCKHIPININSSVRY